MDRSDLMCIRNVAHRLLAAAESKDPMIHFTAKEVLNNILESLSMAEPSRPRASTHKKSRAVNLLGEYIEAQLDEPITLLDLCSVAKASPRTVQRLFKKRFGVTSKEYIQAQRLNRVHRDLLKGKSREKKVSDIANRWGFWHMG
jgi:AraC-like DNA-binding protein